MRYGRRRRERGREAIENNHLERDEMNCLFWCLPKGEKRKKKEGEPGELE